MVVNHDFHPYVYMYIFVAGMNIKINPTNDLQVCKREN